MKMEDKNLRSEEVQDILGKFPPWILRCGISFCGLFILMMLVGSMLFRYPEVVSTQMVLTSTVPIENVIAKRSGAINNLFVTDGQTVQAGDYLAVIENTATTKDVVALKTYLNELSRSNKVDTLPSLMWKLGNMQTTYLQFYQELRKKRNDTKDEDLNILSSKLYNEIILWEDNYVMRSKSEGKVIFSDYWAPNQFVAAGSIVFDVFPSDYGALIGKIALPVGLSGKVKTGQKVDVYFENLPDEESGVVKGVVENISLLPKNGTYILSVSFPDGLLTNHKKTLSVKVGTPARANIIIKERSLLERFLKPLRML